MTERQCEKIIDYFNEQLPEKETKEFEEHLASCESCQEELKELRLLTEDLPFMSESLEPPTGMKERIFTNMFSEEENKTTTQDEDRNKEVPLLSQNKTEEEPVQLNRKSKSSPIIYGSLAAALLLSLVGNGYLWNERQDLADENQQIAMERDIIESDFLALLEEGEEGGGTSDVLLTSNLSYAGEEESDGEGTATIIAKDGNVDLVIQVSDLPPVTGSEVFQAWIIDGETPHPAGNFNIDEDGNGAVTYRISDMEDFQIDQIAITLEPQPGNEQPEGQIILASK
ncbi:hypothetical protein CR194_15325 [Salipaludibacillus keqinensis]|uniref:Anti-sigma-W factor RsiW n=1 Tax=Salipaludibacillus keqinensis TaxID=2045207 RepID=A0A323TIG1_9BACI|nr:anti-sigma factor [Salipaludibacillus keqinensis]PYZ92443.1 hypothetical protein CR194_15325 [Salipaludibacillus keqinensis]